MLIQLGNNVSNVDVSPEFDAYSKVIIDIDGDTQVVAGDDSGLTLEFTNPFGNQDMANRILASLKGFRYSPYNANGALLDPAAEIGDAVQTTTSFGGIYSRYRKFDSIMPAEISAPYDQELDHEFTYEAPAERKFKRTVKDVRASIILTNNMIQSEVVARENADSNLASSITQTADAISAEVTRATTAEGTLQSSIDLNAEAITAKVSASGGENTTGSFSWSLTATGHNWYANGSKTPVMSVTASGLTVNGIINAKEGGTIGGFNIGKKAIYKSIESMDSTLNSGIYLGTDGLRLGKNFTVNTSGTVTASNIKLKGSITFIDSEGNNLGNLTAEKLKTGAEKAYGGYSSWDGAAAWCGSGGGGYEGVQSWNNAQNSLYGVKSLFVTSTMGNFGALKVYESGYFQCFGGFYIGNTQYTPKTATINGTTIYYLGY